MKRLSRDFTFINRKTLIVILDLVYKEPDDNIKHMNKEELIHEVRQFCIQNEDSERAAKLSRYFKEAPDAYGLTQPLMNNKAKEMLKSKAFGLETALEAAPELMKSGKYEEITIAILLVNGFEKQYTASLLNEISNWFTFSIHNWAHADGLGMFILPKFFRNKFITDKDLRPWIKSTYKFQRRCVPVTLIKTLKTRTEFQSIFQMLEPLMQDPEREVHQGMGWFLRDAWKLKPEETEAFLLKWKDRAPRLIIQYATEKMTPEKKQQFKKIK